MAAFVEGGYGFAAEAGYAPLHTVIQAAASPTVVSVKVSSSTISQPWLTA